MKAYWTLWSRRFIRSFVRRSGALITTTIFEPPS